MADDPTDPSETDDKPDDVEAIKTALKKANKEAETFRLRLKELEPLAAKAKELEDAGKSEVEKLTARLAEAEKRTTTAETARDRYEVALSKGLDLTRAKRLTGTSREEFEADADELAKWSPTQGDTPAPGKPVEDLRGGGDPEDTPVETNPAKLAASVPRY